MLIHADVTENYSDLNNLPCVMLSSCNVTLFEINLRTKSPIVVGSVVMLAPYLPVFYKR